MDIGVSRLVVHLIDTRTKVAAADDDDDDDTDDDYDSNSAILV
jgi:hypothetical protein